MACRECGAPTPGRRGFCSPDCEDDYTRSCDTDQEDAERAAGHGAGTLG